MLNNDGMLRQRTDVTSRKREREASAAGAAKRSGKVPAKGAKGVISYMRTVNAATIQDLDEERVFEGKSFYVPSFSASKYAGCPPGMQSNKALQTVLLQMGASVSAHFPKHTARVFAIIPQGVESTASVKAMLLPEFEGKTDILYPAWVERCRDAAKLIPLEPAFGLHFSALGRAEIKMIADLESGVVLHRPMDCTEVTRAADSWLAKPQPGRNTGEDAKLKNSASGWWDDIVAQHSSQLLLVDLQKPLVAPTLLCENMLLAFWDGTVYFDWRPSRRILPLGATSMPPTWVSQVSAVDIGTLGVNTSVLGAELEWRRLGGRVAPCVSSHVTVIVTELSIEDIQRHMKSSLHPATRVARLQWAWKICAALTKWFLSVRPSVAECPDLSQRSAVNAKLQEMTQGDLSNLF
jgi:hypothetical protein